MKASYVCVYGIPGHLQRAVQVQVSCPQFSRQIVIFKN